MFRTRMTLASLVVAAVLAGCSSTGGDAPSKASSAPVANDGRCDASGLASMIGKPATKELLEEARKASGSMMVRALKPHDVVTLEYRSERLNVNTDEQGVVQRVNCG